MINPHRIRYNNIFSNELNIPNLITCVAFDSDSGEVNTFLSREAVASESYDGKYKRIHRFKHTETFAPKFTFTKSNFEDFSLKEVRATLKWLTSKDTASLLEVYYNDSDNVSFASIGGFVNLQQHKLANNRTVAITAEWDSCMPFALSRLYDVKKQIYSATDRTITIIVDTDDNQPVYPCIEIDHGYNDEPHYIVNTPTGNIFDNPSDMVDNTVYYNDATYYWINQGNVNVSQEDPHLSTTSVKIRNKHTDRFGNTTLLPSVIVKNNTTTERVTIDGANKIISSSRTNRIFGDDFANWQWLELYDGINELTIEGNCEITLKWRTVIKCGEY